MRLWRLLTIDGLFSSVPFRKESRRSQSAGKPAPVVRPYNITRHFVL